MGLPLTYRGDQWPKLLETMKLDKKSRGDLLRFIVLDGLAKPTVLEGPTRPSSWQHSARSRPESTRAGTNLPEPERSVLCRWGQCRLTTA